MSNRQARREQSRRSRMGGSRPSQRRPSAPGTGGGGPGQFLTGRFTLIAMGVVAVLIVGIGAFAAFSAGSSQNQSAADALTAAHEDFPSELASGFELGMDDAPLVITQYEDFRCPHCLDYTTNNEPGIIEEYVNTGQVKLVFQNFAVLGAESVNAAKAAVCAEEQDMFWDLHYAFFFHQADAGNSMDFSDDAVRGRAQDVGLDMEDFDACYAAPETLETVQDQRLDAQSYGLSGTPGFLFNGVPTVGAPTDLDGWRTVLDDELQRIAEEGEDSEDGEETPADDDTGATATP